MLSKDVGVPHKAQLASKPLQVTPRVTDPQRIQNRFEGLQIRAKPTGCHPCLVDGFRRRVFFIEPQ